MDNDDFDSLTSSFHTNNNNNNMNYNSLSTPLNPNNQRNTINNLPVVTLGGQDESSFNQSTPPTSSSGGGSQQPSSIFSSFRLRNNNNNSSSNNNNIENEMVHIEGFIQKQGKFVKSWKRRFFVFHDQSNLTYYTDARKKKKKGSLNIDKSIIVECFNEFKNEYNIFKIVTKKRVLYLKTFSSDEMFKWIDKFKEVNHTIQFLDVLPSSNEMTETNSDSEDDDEEEEEEEDQAEEESDRLTDENMSTVSSALDILDANSKNYVTTRQSMRPDLAQSLTLSSLIKYNEQNDNNDDVVDMNVLKDKTLAREELQYLGQRQVNDHYDDDEDDDVQVVVKSTKKSINHLPGKSTSFSVLSTSTRKVNSFSAAKKEEPEQPLVIEDITSFFIMSTEKNDNTHANDHLDHDARSNSTTSMSSQRKKIQLLAPIEKTNPLDKAFQDLHSSVGGSGGNSFNGDMSMLLVKQNYQSSIKEKSFNEYYQSISQEQSIHTNNSGTRGRRLSSLSNTLGIMDNEQDSDDEDDLHGDENDWLMRKSEPMSNLIVHPSFREYSHGGAVTKLFILISAIIIMTFISTKYLINNTFNTIDNDSSLMFIIVFSINLVLELIFMYPILIYLFMDITNYRMNIFKYYYHRELFDIQNSKLFLSNSFVGKIVLLSFLLTCISSILQYGASFGLFYAINRSSVWDFIFYFNIGHVVFYNFTLLFIAVFIAYYNFVHVYLTIISGLLLYILFLVIPKSAIIHGFNDGVYYYISLMFGVSHLFPLLVGILLMVFAKKGISCFCFYNNDFLKFDKYILKRLLGNYFSLFGFSFFTLTTYILNAVIIYYNYSSSEFVAYMIVTCYSLVYIKICLLGNSLITIYSRRCINRLNYKGLIHLNIKSILLLVVVTGIFICIYLVTDITNIVMEGIKLTSDSTIVKNIDRIIQQYWIVSFTSSIVFVFMHCYQMFIVSHHYSNSFIPLIGTILINLIITIPGCLICLLVDSIQSVYSTFIIQMSVYAICLLAFILFYYVKLLGVEFKKEYNRMIAHILHQRYQDEETFQKGKGNPDIPIDTILQQYVQINGSGNN